MNEGHQRLRELKEKDKKQGEKEDQTEERDEGEPKRRLKGKSHLVMLARNNDVVKNNDDKTPTPLLDHAFHVNHSTSPILHSISLVL